MILGAKIEAFREYLREEFPGWELFDADDFDRRSWRFRVTKEDTIHVVYVRRSFWDDYGDTREALQRLGLAETMRDNPGRPVLVRTDGAEPVDEKR